MSEYVVQILVGLASGGILFLVASGLTLVFGALRIVNFAHGSLYMLGAFLMYSIGSAVGQSNVTFWISLVLAALAVGAIGALIEITVLRPIYSRPMLTQLTVTFGVVFVVAGVVRAIYGAAPRGLEPPPMLDGSIKILGQGFPVYQLFLIALAIVVAIGLWALLYRTSLGSLVRAASADSQLLSASGVNVPLLFTGVFAISAMLAGLAGAAVASQGAVSIGMDVDVLVKAFAIVVIGGMGSLLGTLVASILVGVAEALGILWIPNSTLVIVFGLLVVVLAIRPQGLFGQPELAGAPSTAAVPRSLGGLARRLWRSRRAVALAPPTLPRGLTLSLAAVVILAAGLFPLVGSASMILVGTSALCMALFALSLNLLVGTTGLVSFGHALFFGFGAYTVALVTEHLQWATLSALALTPLVGLLVALVTGLIALRASALYFSLLTLGIAQVVYALVIGERSIAHGSDGLHGFLVPMWLFEPKHMYWFVFGCVAVSALILWVITISPFGQALRGIRDNRRRAEFVGLAPKRYEYAAYAVSGLFASIAGGLFAVVQLGAYPDLLNWTLSGQGVIMVLLGGIGSFLGPAVGAFFYMFLNDAVASRTAYWDLVIGVIVVGVALFMPYGIVGAIQDAARGIVGWSRRLRGRRPTAPAVAVVDEPPPAPFSENGTVADEAPRPAAASGGPPVLQLEGVSKRFGGLAAVQGVDLAVADRSIHAIIGPNGAGKTTLFNLITGLMRPDAGSVVLNGVDVTGARPWRLVHEGMGRSFQQATNFWTLSTLDNLALSRAAALGASSKPYGGLAGEIVEDSRAIALRLGLDSAADVAARELSHGDQRALEIGAALAVDSKLLLLDEPTAGLSPVETRAAVQTIRAIAAEEQLAVLFVEHDMDVVFGIADRITVLHHGQVLAEGDPDEVRANSDVRKAYLGGSHA